MLRNFKSTEDWRIHDMYVEDGQVECMDCVGKKDGDVVDCGGRLMIPPMVNSHAHLTIWSSTHRVNQSGTLIEGNEIYSEMIGRLSSEDVERRLMEASKVMFSHGVLLVRSHDPPLESLNTILSVRRGLPIRLQEVVFPLPGSGETSLEKFLEDGAEAVGGIPNAEDTVEDGKKSIEMAFRLAKTYGKMVDLHVDETDDPLSRLSSYAVALAMRSGMCERTTLSHVTGSHSYPSEFWASMKKCGSLVVNPITNAFLQGRYDSYPKRRGLARVRDLIGGDINVSLGTDNVMDSVYPLGDFNVLRVAYQLAVWEGIDLKEVLPMITFNGAKALGVKDYDFPRAGKRAQLVILDCRDLNYCDPSSLPFLVLDGKRASRKEGRGLIGEVD